MRGATKRRPRAAAAARRDRTEAERRRLATLAGAAVTQMDIKRHLEQRGVDVARSTVQAVIAGKFRNDDVIYSFCRLTNTKPSEMFPDTERVA